MLLSEFDYELPEELIAQLPADKRENSRMLVLERGSHTISHKHFYDIVDLIENDTLLVLNDTKVMPARLIGHKDTGAKIEVFLLKNITPRPLRNKGNRRGKSLVTLFPEAERSGEREEVQLEPDNKNKAKVRTSGEGFVSEQTANTDEPFWEVLIKPSKRVKPETIITISDELSVRAIERTEEDGGWIVELIYEGNLLEVLHRNGNIPLPPYIERKLADEDIKKLDFERYQTVYAKDEGSVAAPTAGLHFTQEILQKLKDKGVEIAYVTLNVGLGTFRPVKCENILEHKMHSETFEISEVTARKINEAKAQGKKITAVGTTTVRTLETAYQQFGEIKACHSASELFIYPPYEFKVIDNLITNFHLPKSTLLMLVSALAGKDCIYEAYNQADEKNYRFFSYGDCMFIK